MYTQSNWYQYMDAGMRGLVDESYRLIDELESHSQQFVDFSFLVFPMAKAYEGFLKRLFFDLGLINKQQYYGEHFRIGRALNPNLPKRYRDGWVYGKLVEWCNGEELPQALWETWKRGRNQVFHFFVDQSQVLSFAEAKQLVAELAGAMEKAMEGCRLEQEK